MHVPTDPGTVAPLQTPDRLVSAWRWLRAMVRTLRADVVMANSGHSLVDFPTRSLHLLDLPVYKALGKKVVVTFQGCDVRPCEGCPVRAALPEGVDCVNLPADSTYDPVDDVKSVRFSHWSKYADAVLGGTPDLCRGPGSPLLRQRPRQVALRGRRRGGKPVRVPGPAPGGAHRLSRGERAAGAVRREGFARMTTRDYQICTRCVMDTSDPDIRFDEDGVCSHCHNRDEHLSPRVPPPEEAGRQLQRLVHDIERDGRGKPYDCVIGVSGGVDSTFVAYKVRELGLRPLAVHLDNGWDSELAVKNIENTLRVLEIDLYTHVLDWDEFRDLQLAFLRASTPDSEIPTDHAIISLLYREARRHGLKYILSGVNARTESHLPAAWSSGHTDWRYIRAVHRRFGTRPLRTYPHLNWLQFRTLPLRYHWVDVLNYLDYVKKDALKVLERELGWKYYGGKHYESIYTRFYQGYILPRKFGFDKRRTHFSSLVCAGEMTREEALRALREEPYPPELQMEDRAYVTKKLGLTDGEFEAILALPPKTFWDYPSYLRAMKHPLYRRAASAYRAVRAAV